LVIYPFLFLILLVSTLVTTSHFSITGACSSLEEKEFFLSRIIRGSFQTVNCNIYQFQESREPPYK